ncbi:MAG TPA: rRNA maturation RNase YbeY [Anaeromyxobacteraceae bacterium]|nr:rRNA maturation RNase YbeY [Anaeromyxobacteraceae bacterium]
MTVELRSDHPSGSAVSRRVRARARALLAAAGRPGAGLSILLTRDGPIRTLNRRWRGVDHATDVLSFPATDPPGAGDDLGDLAISLDVASRRARRAGRTLAEEVDLYLVHGILHLLGHDHVRPGEAREMARAEDALLGRAGMVRDALRRRPARPRRARS